MLALMQLSTTRVISQRWKARSSGFSVSCITGVNVLTWRWLTRLARAVTPKRCRHCRRLVRVLFATFRAIPVPWPASALASRATLAVALLLPAVFIVLSSPLPIHWSCSIPLYAPGTFTVSGSVTPGSHRHYPSMCREGDFAGALLQEHNPSSLAPHPSLPREVRTHWLRQLPTRNPGSASSVRPRSGLFPPGQSQSC